MVRCIRHQRIASPGKGLRLGHLLQELDCPFGYLHNAGNDANYTLRALLLLTVRGFQDMVSALTSAERSVLSDLKSIAHFHLSIPTEARFPGFSGIESKVTRRRLTGGDQTHRLGGISI